MLKKVCVAQINYLSVRESLNNCSDVVFRFIRTQSLSYHCVCSIEHFPEFFPLPFILLSFPLPNSRVFFASGLTLHCD